MKRSLYRKEWKRWVLEQVFRPYQGLLGFEKRLERFQSSLWHDLPDLATENPEWFDLMTKRLAMIYDRIDEDFLPYSGSRDLLWHQLSQLGVRIIRRTT